MNTNLKQVKRWLQSHRTIVLLWVFTFTLHIYYFLHNRTFGQDQARDVMLAQGFLSRGQWWIAYGPKASVGDFYLPPLYYYLQTLVTAVSSWPLSMGLLITVVESFSPVLIYQIFKKWLSGGAGVIGAILYAVSPLVITFATFMWNPNMIPFFLLTGLFTTFIYVTERKPQIIVWSWLSVTIAFHLHYQAVAVFLFYALVYSYLLFKRRQDWKWYLAAGLVSLATLTPYLVTELNTGWPNTRAIYQYFTVDHAQTYEIISKPGYIWLFLPEFFSRLTFLPSWSGAGIKYGRLLLLLLAPGLGLVLTSKFFFPNKKFTKADLISWLILFYIFTCILMLRVYKGYKIDYYMSMLFFAPAMLAALGWHYLKLFRWPIVLGLMIIMFSSGHFYGRKLGRIYNTLRDSKQVFNFIQQKVGDRPIYPVIYHQEFDVVWKYGSTQIANLNMVTDWQASPEYVVQLCESGDVCDPLIDNVCQTDSNVERAGLRYQIMSQPISLVRYRYGQYTVLISEVKP